ncbi:MAG: UDP-N-acetylmuramoyl-tripeptide--D-alanyl-D-alanine ligase [Phycisphaerales bacterium]|nr:UDP-N-acetylmuramoyl-tripeptide--D-alanyl-D-alanine ligase [Phycisphaerales bacterium]
MAEAALDFLSASSISRVLQGTWNCAPRSNPVGVATDTRESMEGRLFVALKGDRFDAHEFLPQAFAQGAVGAIVERGTACSCDVPCSLLVVDNTRAALAVLATAWRHELSALTVAAITGSAGKTTTRRLIEAACASTAATSASVKSFNNEIGVPLTMLSVRRQHRFLVAEIGMSHPGEILPLTRIVAPEVAVVTFAGRAHLEGMGSIEAVAQEKASIFEALASGARAVMPAEAGPLADAIARLKLPERGIQCVRFGTSADADVRLVRRTASTTGSQHIEIFARAGVFATIPAARTVQFECALPGEHNARNATAALAAALALGIDLDAAVRGIGTVVPTDMRFVREDRQGVTFFNDTYNANPDAMLAALRTFAELAAGADRRVAFLGEMLELGPSAATLHREIGHAAAAASLDALIAVGPYASEVKDAYELGGGRGIAFAFTEFGSEAMDAARAHTTPGTHVLVKGSRGARMERFLAEFR